MPPKAALRGLCPFQTGPAAPRAGSGGLLLTGKYPGKVQKPGKGSRLAERERLERAQAPGGRVNGGRALNTGGMLRAGRQQGLKRRVQAAAPAGVLRAPALPGTKICADTIWMQVPYKHETLRAYAEATEKGGGFNGTGRTCFFGATGQGCPGVLPRAGELPLWGRHKGKDGRPSGFASAGAGRRPRRKGKGAFGWARRDKKKKPGLCACAPRRHVPGVCAGPAGSAVHRGVYCVEKRRAAARA